MTISEDKISCKKLLEFYKECSKNKTYNHGLLITENGETLFENYILPYSKEMPHTLFSVTKSLVSTAVGFAVDEGLLTLDTKISPYFTDYKQSKGTENITVRDLLTMHSGKKFSFLQDMTGDYVEIFMKAGFRKQNGFLYSNNDAHILSALIQRITGIKTVDYLMPRLFQPLGIEKPQWETDCNGVCVGGTGGYLPLRSLVKIVQCYLDGGKYEGRQVIPRFWTEQATVKQIGFGENSQTDEGYGYLFWTTPDSFCMNGLYGQIIAGYPKKGVVIGFTSCAVNDGLLQKLSNEYLVPALGEKSSDGDKEKLTEFLLSENEKTEKCDVRKNVPDGIYKITSFSKVIAGLFFSAALIPRGIISSMAKRTMNTFDRFSFKKSDDEIEITWFEDEDKVTVKCSLNGEITPTECDIKGYHFIIRSFGKWENDKLTVNISPINTLSSMVMTFDFRDKSFTLKLNEKPDFTAFILKNITQVAVFEKSKILKSIGTAIMKVMLLTVKRPIKFKRER